jgi:hypothetical protein
LTRIRCFGRVEWTRNVQRASEFGARGYDEFEYDDGRAR